MNHSEDAFSQQIGVNSTPCVNQKKRTRVGKTPAEKIVWTPDEVSKFDLNAFNNFLKNIINLPFLSYRTKSLEDL